MASKVAKVLRGKYKTNYTPHADCGDYVIIINAGKIIMTGKKMSNKGYFHTQAILVGKNVLLQVRC